MALARNVAVDSVIPGDDESEKAHGFESVDSIASIDDERSWRRATKNGWFSYLMKLPPAGETTLWVEYHGAEIEENQFSILIDGRHLASESNLKNFDLPVIYGKAYQIPRGLQTTKNSVTIKFQTEWPHVTPRVFALRTMTRTSDPQPS